MWYLQREVTISAAHHLDKYEGKCKFVHGHNWKIVVYCKGDRLDDVGMLVDFSKIKAIVMQFDHGDLNELLGNEVDGNINPTAENIAFFICSEVPFCYKVSVEESPGAVVTYVQNGEPNV
jgi:6-pyruvoyltetrahydropterin/6-carboxytetrahydropterin synthase